MFYWSHRTQSQVKCVCLFMNTHVHTHTYIYLNIFVIINLMCVLITLGILAGLCQCSLCRTSVSVYSLHFAMLQVQFPCHWAWLFLSTKAFHLSCVLVLWCNPMNSLSWVRGRYWGMVSHLKCLTQIGDSLVWTEKRNEWKSPQSQGVNSNYQRLQNGPIKIVKAFQEDVALFLPQIHICVC